MNTFEKALRLMLDLHALIRDGKIESEEADKIRDQMAGPWGWHGGSHENDLTFDQRKLLNLISVALNKVDNDPT